MLDVSLAARREPVCGFLRAGTRGSRVPWEGGPRRIRTLSPRSPPGGRAASRAHSSQDELGTSIAPSLAHPQAFWIRARPEPRPPQEESRAVCECTSAAVAVANVFVTLHEQMLR